MLNKRKKIKYNEAHWTLSSQGINPNDQANKVLQSKTGNDISRHFAKLNVGSDFFEWTFTCDSEPMTLSQAPEDDAMIVRDEYNKLGEQVMKCFSSNSHIGERFLHVPNEDFIYYYKDAAGRIQIVLTGWGFTNRRGPSLGPTFKKIPIQESAPIINIGFTRDGEMVTDRKFLLSTAIQSKPNELTTSADGFYHFDKPFKAGSEFTVTDEISGKEFPLRVEADQTDYVFDITQYAPIIIKVTHNDEPVVGKQVALTYRGNTQMLMTDGNGNITTSLVFIDNEEVTAEVEGCRETRVIAPEGVEIAISLKTAVTSPMVKTVDQNGNNVGGYHLVLDAVKGQVNIVTDENGCAILPEMEVGEVFYLTDDNGQKLSFQVNEENSEHIFPVYLAPPVITPLLKVVDQNGNPLPGYDMMFAAAQGQYNVRSDEMGIVALPGMNIDETFSVSDAMGNTMTYQITPDTNEFYFYVNIQEQMVRIRVLDTDNTPLDNLPVYVDTPLGTFSSMSDDYGYALFPASAFVDKQKAKVRFTVTKEYRMRKKQQR